MSIRLAVLDLGGTIVDRYSLSPFISLKQAFKNKRINVNNNLIYKDMGMNKQEHIGEILNDKYTRRIWFKLYGQYPNSSSMMSVYESLSNIKWMRNQNIDILPVKNTINWLKANNINTGMDLVDQS